MIAIYEYTKLSVRYRNRVKALVYENKQSENLAMHYIDINKGLERRIQEISYDLATTSKRESRLVVTQKDNCIHCEIMKDYGWSHQNERTLYTSGGSRTLQRIELVERLNDTQLIRSEFYIDPTLKHLFNDKRLVSKAMTAYSEIIPVPQHELDLETHIRKSKYEAIRHTPPIAKMQNSNEGPDGNIYYNKY